MTWLHQILMLYDTILILAVSVRVVSFSVCGADLQAQGKMVLSKLHPRKKGKDRKITPPIWFAQLHNFIPSVPSSYLHFTATRTTSFFSLWHTHSPLAELTLPTLNHPFNSPCPLITFQPLLYNSPHHSLTLIITSPSP